MLSKNQLKDLEIGLHRLGKAVSLNCQDDFETLEPSDFNYYLQHSVETYETSTGRVFSGHMTKASGTTGVIRYIPLPYEELELEGRIVWEALQLDFPIRPGSRVLDLSIAGDMAASYLLMDAVFRNRPVTHFPVFFSERLFILESLLKDHKPNIIIASRDGLNCLMQCPNEWFSDQKIETILAFGALIRDADRSRWQEYFHPLRVGSFVYGSVDCGMVAKPLIENPRRFQVLPDAAYLEIVDPSYQPIRENGVKGEVLVTSLYRKAFPIVRFKIGDIGHWVDYNQGIFELHGRGGQSLVINGVQIDFDSLRELAAEEFDDIDFQLIAESSESGDLLKIAHMKTQSDLTFQQRLLKCSKLQALKKRHPKSLIFEPVESMKQLHWVPGFRKLLFIVDRRNS